MSEDRAGGETPAWDEEVRIRPLGVVRSPRADLSDDHWGNLTSVIELEAGRLTPESVRGLDQFSHLEVIWFLHRVTERDVESGARHPRNRPDWPLVGILAQRAKRRPNRLAVSCCELLSVDGLRLTVRGLDAADGTPVLDVKPYFREFAPRSAVWQPAWVSELMRDYYSD